jgi:hypothetical protein
MIRLTQTRVSIVAGKKSGHLHGIASSAPVTFFGWLFLSAFRLIYGGRSLSKQLQLNPQMNPLGHKNESSRIQPTSPSRAILSAGEFEWNRS